VLLFVVSVRAATPSKSRDEISVRGKGCDTPSDAGACPIFSS
jgi:hypothetical protein